MEALKDNKEWIELKANLQSVEDKILELKANLQFVEDKIFSTYDLALKEEQEEQVNIDTHGLFALKKELEEQIKELLPDRHFIMDKMFRLHVTEQEIARFREVNAHLLDLTRKLFSEQEKLLDSLEGNPVLSVTCSGDVFVESELNVDIDAEAFHYDDDDDYGSNFSQMINAITKTERMGARTCSAYLGRKAKHDYLDHSSTWSWAEGCLDIPQFNDIVVCYAVNNLCTYMNYSVPDLLRIQSYSLLITIRGGRKYIV